MNFLQKIKHKFSNKPADNQPITPKTPKSKTKRVLWIIAKVFMWIFGSILGLFALIFILLFLPPVQDYLTGKAEDFLSKKLTTKVEVETIRLSLPLGLSINGLYIEDLQQDTLLYAGHFEADINPFALINKTLQITEIKLEDVYANIWIAEDSTSNIDFLNTAFAPTDSAKMSDDQTTTQIESNDSTGIGFVISLGGIDFRNINAKFDDRFNGNDIKGKIGQIKVDVDDFDLNNLAFTVHSLLLKDTDVRYIQTKEPPKRDEKPDTTSTELGFQVNMNKIDFENVTAFYQSNVTGQQVKGKVGTLSIDAQKTNLGTQEIIIKEVALKNTYISYKQGIVATALDSVINESAETIAEEAQQIAGTKKDEGKPWTIEVKNLVLANNEFVFDNDKIDKIEYGFDTNHIHFKNIAVEAENFKFYPSTIAADIKTIQATDNREQFQLTDFDGNIRLDSNGVSVTKLNIQTTRSKIGQTVKLAASLENLAKNWQNADLEINLDGTEIALADIFYFVPDLANQLAFSKKTTETIKISGQATGKANNATLKNFQIKGLNNTHLLVNGIVKGLPDVEKIYADIKVNKLTSSRSDLQKIVPRGTLPAGYNFPQKISMTASAKGSMQNMFVELLANLDNTKIELGGTLKNPTDPQKMYLDIATKQFLVYTNDIENWLPKNMIPSNIILPPKIDGNIVFTGLLNDFEIDTKFDTELGNVGVKGTMQNAISETKIPSYDITAVVENAQLGKILQDTTLGIADLQLSADGSGFDLESIKTTINGNVNKFEFQKYVYKDLKIDGRIDGNTDGIAYNGKLNMKDKNLNFDFDANVVWDTLNPKFVVDLDLRKADLQALNLYAEPLSFSLMLDADITGMDLDNIRGNIGLQKVIIDTKKKTFRIDSAAFISIAQKGETNINLRSDILSAKIEGNLDFSTFVATLKNHINTYIEIDPVLPSQEIGTQQMDFDIQIHKSDLLTALVPDLTKFEPASFKGQYRSDAKKFELNGNFPSIIYAGITMDSLTINIDSDREALNYRIGVAEITNGTVQFKNPIISGKAANNKADLKINLKDEKGKERFEITTFLERPDTTQFIISLAPQQILNYDNWTAKKGNQIVLGKTLSIKDFLLSNQNQTISAQTTNEDKNLVASFKNFELSTITDMVSLNDTTKLATGRLNGDVNLQNFQTEMQILANLKIDELTVLNSKLGDLKIDANNSQKKDRYDVNVKLTGENKFELTGYYNAAQNTSDALNMNLDIERLSLPTLESLAMGNLENMEGTVTGNLKIKGTTEKPAILGNLDFNQTSFFLTATGTYLHLEKETINFDNNGIGFKNFTLQDKKNNVLYVNGRINMPTFTDLKLNLNVKSDKFLFVDSKKSKNLKEEQLFFGKALAGLDVDIKGNITSPVVTANVNVLEGTDLTYVMPESEIATIDKEGVVEFVDRDFYSDSLISLEPKGDTTKYGTDMDIRAIIKISPLAKMTVYIDASNQLEVQGGGDINFNLNPSGEMSLTGRYEITEGIYKLNFFNIAKRDFKIKQGSSIVFYGDIMDMKADISAIYTVEAASYELMANQLGNSSEAELNKYKQKLPFEVVLKMSGDILNPILDFDVDIAEKERGAMGGTINTRLQLLNKQESEVNKQVFALLILGGFISENPLDRAQGEMGFAETQARNTVNGLLTDQLNKLADKNLSGLGLSFDLNSFEDYSTGESQTKTELGINLSKSFLDDRLTFQVGTNVDLEGESAQQDQQQGLSSIAGDVIISYLITEDGRYKVQIFRENSYAGVIDGQIIQTGASLIFVREYDKISELFTKDKEAERIKKEIKQREKQRKEEQKRKKKEEKKKEDEEENTTSS